MIERFYGRLNGHAVGIILKELVRRAIVTIRNERAVFDVTQKAGHDGAMTDVFTSADRKAQEIYLRSLRECFPNHGIIAEEDSLTVAAQDGAGYFTVDPLDGTKAFIRRQSHGVGTMIALVEGGEVISAYIGDINTQEIYGFRPDSRRVHRITEFEASEELRHTDRPLGEQYILLRDPERAYTEASRRLLSQFKSWEIEGGSIGIWLARLWKREVGAALLPPSVETPWDRTPIVGIATALGYVFCEADANGSWQPLEPAVSATAFKRDCDQLVIHRNDLPKLTG
jgi:fructose-1,6-bisphosphatase/inositol monophosphatase family enzyme